MSKTWQERKADRAERMKTLDGKSIVVYNSNNSGGSWWLSDQDWERLEEAGWTVHWNILVDSDFSEFGGDKNHISVETGRVYSDDPLANLTHPDNGPRFEGERRREDIIGAACTYEQAQKLRENWGDYMGSLATSCAKAGDPEELKEEFFRVSGQNEFDQGCSCCGEPHSFEVLRPDGSSDYV